MRSRRQAAGRAPGATGRPVTAWVLVPVRFHCSASYTNVSNLTLAEQWNRTGTSTQAVTGRPVAPGALPAACLRDRMPGSPPISGRSPAAAWSRFRAGTPPPASRIWCVAG